MPQGKAEPLGKLNTAEIVERMRQRYEAAGDMDLELFPAPEDLYGVLVYARHHDQVLEKAVTAARRKGPEQQKAAEHAWFENGRDRLLLRRRAAQLLDVEEDASIDAARKAGWTWEQLADPMGMDTRSGPQRRSRTLKQAIKSRWQVRTPKAAKTKATQEEAEARQLAEGHPRVRQAAEALLSVRASFDIDEDLAAWWDDLAFYLDGHDRTTAERSSMVTHLCQAALGVWTQATSVDEDARKALEMARRAVPQDLWRRLAAVELGELGDAVSPTGDGCPDRLRSRGDGGDGC